MGKRKQLIIYYNQGFADSDILCTFVTEIKHVMIMTSYSLNNLWTYLQGLSLAKSDREWLAGKLIDPASPSVKDAEKNETETPAIAKTSHRMRPLSPEIELLGNIHLREFTQEELDNDPLLAALIKDRRRKK